MQMGLQKPNSGGLSLEWSQPNFSPQELTSKDGDTNLDK